MDSRPSRTYRFVYDKSTNALTLDPDFTPVPYVRFIGQKPGTAVAVMGDYAIVQTNYVLKAEHDLGITVFSQTGCGMIAGAGRWLLVEAEEIRALVDGRKTRKRGVITAGLLCPFGKPGDLLWVRESCGQDRRDRRVVVYEATPDCCRGADGVIRDEPDEGRLDALKHHRCWKRVRALGMPRSASRLTLEITAIRAGWVQGISEADARAEGFAAVSEYRRCWEGWCLWHQNLPVWILTFIVHQRHVTEVEPSADRNRGKDKTGLLFSYGPVSRRRTYCRILMSGWSRAWPDACLYPGRGKR